jgi:translation initiation factor 1
MDIDPITGLPKELGAFEEISKESQVITVTVIKKKFGKKYTLVEGLEGKGIDTKEVTKALKGKFACGGTFKDGRVELQGDYRSRIKEALTKLGFEPENVQIK